MPLVAQIAKRAGQGGGWAVYYAARAAATAANRRRERRPLAPDTQRRLARLFPTVDLVRVRVTAGATLPANWLVRPASVTGMTFGFDVYTILDGDLEHDYRRMLLLIHELVHVRQVSELGEAAFARRYGEEWLTQGGYTGMPLEREARDFVSRLPFDPARYREEHPELAAIAGADPLSAFFHWLELGRRAQG